MNMLRHRFFNEVDEHLQEGIAFSSVHKTTPVYWFQVYNFSSYCSISVADFEFYLELLKDGALTYD